MLHILGRLGFFAVIWYLSFGFLLLFWLRWLWNNSFCPLKPKKNLGRRQILHQPSVFLGLVDNCTFLFFPNYILIMTTNIMQCFPSSYEADNRFPNSDRNPWAPARVTVRSTEGGREHFQARLKEPSSRTEEAKATYGPSGRNSHFRTN